MPCCAWLLRCATETVWSAVPDDALLRGLLDMKEFENLFQVKRKTVEATNETAAQKAEQRRKQSRMQEIALLDPKRAYNIGIIVSRMRMSLPAIRQAFLRMDETRPTDEELKAFLTVLPTPDEVRRRMSASPRALLSTLSPPAPVFVVLGRSWTPSRPTPTTRRR